MRDGFIHASLTSFDGTTIAYQHRPGRQGAPVVVVANGLGGNWAAWRHLYRALDDEVRIISWDYRGLLGSGPPGSGGVSVATQTRDLLEVLQTEAVERALFVGWGMGVQVLLELMRSHPELARGLCLINGTPGRMFARMRGGPVMRRLLPSALAYAEVAAPALGTMLRGAALWSGLVPALKWVGVVTAQLDDEILDELTADYATMDVATCARTLRACNRHDASDVLPRIVAPTLVIAAERDLLTPLAEARALVEHIPTARLLVVPGRAHNAEAAEPTVVNDAIVAFLAEIWPAS